MGRQRCMNRLIHTALLRGTIWTTTCRACTFSFQNLCFRNSLYRPRENLHSTLLLWDTMMNPLWMGGKLGAFHKPLGML